MPRLYYAEEASVLNEQGILIIEDLCASTNSQPTPQALTEKQVRRSNRINTFLMQMYSAVDSIVTLHAWCLSDDTQAQSN